MSYLTNTRSLIIRADNDILARLVTAEYIKREDLFAIKDDVLKMDDIPFIYAEKIIDICGYVTVIGNDEKEYQISYKDIKKLQEIYADLEVKEETIVKEIIEKHEEEVKIEEPVIEETKEEIIAPPPYLAEEVSEESLKHVDDKETEESPVEEPVEENNEKSYLISVQESMDAIVNASPVIERKTYTVKKKHKH